QLRTAFPATELAVQPEGVWPHDLDALVAAALAPHLALPGGGGVHIDETPAAVLIDVDSGTPEAGSAARAALAANLDAARLIARQLRLRNLGGGIVVDFVGLGGRGLRERVRQAMTDALSGDPAQPQCLGWTRLGHLEIVRPYRSRSLAAALLDPCEAAAPSAATLAFAALRAVQRQARAEPAAQWRLTVTPAIAAVLREAAAGALAALEARLGRPVELAVAEICDAPSFSIARR
ncbi:MAG: ribonuclease E/G, partial [Stellaceae bacterium]